MVMKPKKYRIPYERHAGNMIPESSKKGTPFVDFNKVIKKKVKKIVRKKKNANISTK